MRERLITQDLEQKWSLLTILCFSTWGVYSRLRRKCILRPFLWLFFHKCWF